MATLQTTNRSASTPNVDKNGARLRRKSAHYATGGTQGDGDVLEFFTVRSSDIIDSLLISNDALAGMIDVNVGLRLPDETAVDDNLFVDADTWASAQDRVNLRYGAASALGLETLGQKVYELLGLTDDPFLTYVVTATLVDAGTASGDIVLEMVYTAGD